MDRTDPLLVRLKLVARRLHACVVVACALACSEPAPQRPVPVSSADGSAVRSGPDATRAIGAGPPSDAVVPPADAPPTLGPFELAGCSTPTAPTGNAIPGATPLLVWRSRAEVPSCVAAHVPVDFDFGREMLVSEPPRSGATLRLMAPEGPVTRSNGHLIVELVLASECRPCSGVVQPDPGPPALLFRLTLWRMPRIDGVDAYMHVKAGRACPPCMAP